MNNETQTLDHQLCFALYAATHAVTRAYRIRLTALGLTYPQYLTLMALWDTNGLTVRGLANRLRIDSATLTPLLKRLEAAGFVTRKRSKEDERLVQVYLTERGRTVKAEVTAIQAQVACATGLSQPEHDALRDRLNALVSDMAHAEAQPVGTAAA